MHDNNSSLKRSLGVPQAVALGLGSMVGTGVFVSIFLAGGVAGPIFLGSIALAALVATANAMSSAQLAAAHPVSGGTYEYGYRFLRPSLGFAAGLMFLTAKSASAATAALACSSYALALFGIAARGPRVALAVGVALALTAIVAGGVKRTSHVNAVIVAVTIVSLLVFVLPALLAGDFSQLRPAFVPTGGRSAARATLYAAALSFVAFTGYGRIATLGEEIREPAKNIPRAIGATVIVVAILYLVVGLAGAVTLGTGALGRVANAGGAPLEEAALAVGGPVLRTVIAIGAITATLGVLLNLVLGLSRVALAMGRRGDLPRAFGRVARGTPLAAVVLVGVVVAAIATIGDVAVTWSASAVTVLVYYALTNLAALRLPREFRLYPRWVSVLGLLGCLALAAFVDPDVLAFAGAVLGVGVVWFLVAHRVRRLRD